MTSALRCRVRVAEGTKMSGEKVGGKVAAKWQQSGSKVAGS